MRTLNQYEVEAVSGGTWADFWNSVAGFLSKLFSNNGLDAAVKTCTSNNGAASFTVNGGSYSVTAGAGVPVPMEGAVVPIQVQATGGQTWQNYSVTCVGAHNGGGSGQYLEAQ